MSESGKVASPSGHLLILSCSDRKDGSRTPAPAIHLYDGVNYRVLRKILLQKGWPPDLEIKVLSAEYGLIDATTLINPYDKRLTADVAKKINPKTLAELQKGSSPSSIFINLGKDYLPAVDGIESLFPKARITYADGPIGMKMQTMKRWLEGLRYRTSSIKGYSKKAQSYLYFFPDWDDFVYVPFSANDDEATQGERTYAHELCGGRTPFDGILLSLANLLVGKGALHWTNSHDGRIRLRRHLRIQRNILLFGDCGAFTYAAQPTPPFSSEQAAELYHKYGFDIGASVDHIPLPELQERRSDGTIIKTPLSQSERYARMYLTRNNAEQFLDVCKRRKYGFVPLGVIQGIGTRSYVDRLQDYLDMGYEHIALGGLVPRSDDDILDIVCAIREALQKRTRSRRNNTWIHLFGILRPKLQPIFRSLGVSSFDSASYFRKSWLRSDQNYLAPDGGRWYGTIRIPISTSKPMRLAARREGISEDALAQMERRCLEAIDNCNSDPTAQSQVTSSINQYGPLLERKGEDNHFVEKHELLLSDRPWEQCDCPFCRSAGMHVVVFRGASRNKRRGLHNTWVFYHKILHGNAIPKSSRENK